MFPGDPDLSTTSYIDNLTTTAGYLPNPADGIDWTALGCLPPGPASAQLDEHPANSVSVIESQSQDYTPGVDSPGPSLDRQPPTTTATTSTIPSSNTTISMPSATFLPTPSPASQESSPKENPSRISKRQLNTMAARRYRQRRLDRMNQLEEELQAVKRERDELKMRVSKLEGETDALKSMLKEKSK